MKPSKPGGKAPSRAARTVTVNITVDKNGKPEVDKPSVTLYPKDTLRFKRPASDWEVEVDLRGKPSPFLFRKRRFWPGHGLGQVSKKPADDTTTFKYSVTVKGVTLDPDIVIEPDDDTG